MTDTGYGVIYLIGLLVEAGIRKPHHRRRAGEVVVMRRGSWLEWPLLALLGVSLQVAPLCWVLTPWLDFAAYRLPGFVAPLGVPVLAAAVWLFWRSHADLGRNWSPYVEVRDGHALVSGGVYRRIRHPMYASLWLLGIAQAMLIHNWIAGFATPALFAVFYWLRVGREERLLLERFGDEYRDYVKRTGRILPRTG